MHRLAYNDDVAAGQLAVFQGGPSRTGSNEAPISGFIRVGADPKQLEVVLAGLERFAKRALRLMSSAFGETRVEPFMFSGDYS